jgi:hypothetical protein
MEKNPAKVLKPPKVTTGSKMPFTEGEVNRIIEACDELVTRGTYGKENNARVKAFVLILRYGPPDFRCGHAGYLKEGGKCRTQDGEHGRSQGTKLSPEVVAECVAEARSATRWSR